MGDFHDGNLSGSRFVGCSVHRLGRFAPFSLCCRLAALWAVVFVVGLQPTICMFVVTQGFVRLRLTTPCAKLWQAYSLRHGLVCVGPSGLNCVGGSYLGFHLLRSFHPRLFCVTASRFGRAERVMMNDE